MPGFYFAIQFALFFGSDAVVLFSESSVEIQGAFDEYRVTHKRPYADGSEEYITRLGAFTERYKAVARQNSMPNRTWTAGLNRLTDRTEEEIRSMKGLRFDMRLQHPSGLMLVKVREQSDDVLLKDLPSSWDWRPHLKSLHEFPDQGYCGSCWAFGVVTVLHAFSELYQDSQKFSVQQIVSCTPNPMQCGGNGGCSGATALMAMDHVWKYGVLADHKMPYTGNDSPCPESVARTMKMYDDSTEGDRKHGGESIGMKGWTKLPENKLAPLLLSVYEKGPAAVSIMADGQWSFYQGGILGACRKEAVIDHLVTLAGFGELDDNKYYLIQNSWGESWGEKGFLRLQRHSNEEEAAYCGWDNNPGVGNGCRGGPAKIWVCGSCGILAETVIPDFRTSETSLMATKFKGRVGQA